VKIQALKSLSLKVIYKRRAIENAKKIDALTFDFLENS